MTRTALRAPINAGRAALLTCLAFASTIVVSMSTPVQQATSRHTPPQPLALAVVFYALTLIFYYQLFRKSGVLRITRPLRKCLLAAALVQGVIGLASLPALLRSFGGQQETSRAIEWNGGISAPLLSVRNAATANFGTRLAGDFSRVAYILLLLALAVETSLPSEHSRGISPSFLAIARWATIFWGFWLAVPVMQLAITIQFEAVLRRLSPQMHETAPQFAEWVFKSSVAMLDQASLFTAPFVVYLSLHRARRAAWQHYRAILERSFRSR